jgi:hypothetical protein
MMSDWPDGIADAMIRSGLRAVADAIKAALIAGDPREELTAAYPGWEIDVSPAGMWSAWWISGDGRERRIITAPTPAQLAERLDAIQGVSGGDSGHA